MDGVGVSRHLHHRRRLRRSIASASLASQKRRVIRGVGVAGSQLRRVAECGSPLIHRRKFGSQGKNPRQIGCAWDAGQENGVNSAFVRWHSRCTDHRVVTCVRTRLSAAGILAVVLLTMGAPLLAAVAEHKVCLAKQHDCGKTPRLAQCCRGDNGDVSDQPGVVQPRTHVSDQFAASILATTIAVPRADASSRRVNTSPPHGRSPDLPILFVDLRL